MAKGRKPERRKGVPQHQKKEITAKRIIKKTARRSVAALVILIQ